MLSETCFQLSANGLCFRESYTCHFVDYIKCNKSKVIFNITNCAKNMLTEKKKHSLSHLSNCLNGNGKTIVLFVLILEKQILFSLQFLKVFLLKYSMAFLKNGNSECNGILWRLDFVHFAKFAYVCILGRC